LVFVDELDSVGVLSSGKRLLSGLVGNERLDIFDVIFLTISVSEMVSLIDSSPDRSQEVTDNSEEHLGDVEDVNEFHSVSNVEPLPISVSFHSGGLESEELKESRSSSEVEMGSTLVLVQEPRGVFVDVIIVGMRISQSHLGYNYYISF